MNKIKKLYSDYFVRESINEYAATNEYIDYAVNNGWLSGCGDTWDNFDDPEAVNEYFENLGFKYDEDIGKFVKLVGFGRLVFDLTCLYYSVRLRLLVFKYKFNNKRNK